LKKTYEKKTTGLHPENRPSLEKSIKFHLSGQKKEGNREVDTQRENRVGGDAKHDDRYGRWARKNESEKLQARREPISWA